MTPHQNTTKLSVGTTLILLKECSSSDEFQYYLDSLGMPYSIAYVKMKKALEENLIKYRPQNKSTRPILTLNRRAA